MQFMINAEPQSTFFSNAEKKKKKKMESVDIARLLLYLVG